ncbi:DUF2786 domain-containing protein [Synechococcus phage Ssp-JY38]|nr:hypothetical protein [Synechococcus phage Yong-L2-223]
MTNTDDSKIKAKIAALLAKAEKTDNAFEAETFMAKVNEMLEKHQIEMHELHVDNDPMGQTDGDVTRSHEWPSRLGFALAELYGAKMLRYTYKNVKARYKWRVVGRESARVTFEMLYPFVMSQVRQRARAMARTYAITPAKAEREIGTALEQRIWRMVRDAEERREVAVGKGLIPVSDVDAYIHDLHSKVKTLSTLNVPISNEAVREANKVSLNVQATGANRKMIAGS